MICVRWRSVVGGHHPVHDEILRKLQVSAPGLRTKRYVFQKTILEPPNGTHSPFYQCIKTSLKSVVRDQAMISKIQEAALRANGIVTHTLQMLKLYLIHCYDKGIACPRSIDNS
jgi:hypothetical protein